MTYLSQYPTSMIKWERLAAIGALGKIPNEQTVDALGVVVDNPEPEVRPATSAALFKQSSEL